MAFELMEAQVTLVNVRLVLLAVPTAVRVRPVLL